MVVQSSLVFAGNDFAPLEDWSNPFELFNPESAIHFGDPVVVAQLFVFERLAGCAAALISQFFGKRRDLWVVCDNHAAFTGSDLFIRLEPEDTHSSKRANFAAVEVGPNSLPGVLTHE